MTGGGAACIRPALSATYYAYLVARSVKKYPEILQEMIVRRYRSQASGILQDCPPGR